MRRLLFVDADRALHEQLRTALRPYEAQWSLAFAGSANDALEAVAADRPDVLVTDLRLPDRDGVALLEEVRRRYPGIVRLVHADEVSRANARIVADLAHQFLPRPSSGATMFALIERTASLQAILTDQRVRSLVGGIGQLPIEPKLYLGLTKALEHPDSSLRDLARLVEQAPAVTAKVLQVVNSAFFGLARRCSSVEQAINYIGTDSLRSLVLSLEVFAEAERKTSGALIDMAVPRRRGILAGAIAKQMFPERALAQDAFVAALLHEIGFLILTKRTPENIGRVFFSQAMAGQSLYAVELEEYGVTHAEMGAYLLGLWGLPLPVVEAVAYHHVPSRLLGDTFGIAAGVHVAAALAAERIPLVDGLEIAHDTELDASLLARLGVAERLPEWRTIADAAFAELDAE